MVTGPAGERDAGADRRLELPRGTWGEKGARLSFVYPIIPYYIRLTLNIHYIYLALITGARTVLDWPKRCGLAHAIRWECSYKRLQLARLLGQLGDFLTPGADTKSHADAAACIFDMENHQSNIQAAA
jgi:hypothetical protein